MNATAAVRMPRLSTLLRLGRISNIPTVWTNVLAGSVIAGGDRNPDRIALIMLAMTAFYVGGMYLNDFFDREIDARDRPGRPIHAGEIRAGTVSSIGFGLLATGIALMIPFGLAATIWGALLAGAIVLYDVWHKGNVLSPIVMGTCRALVYIGTGAALAGSTSTATMIGADCAGEPCGGHYLCRQAGKPRQGWKSLAAGAACRAAAGRPARDCRRLDRHRGFSPAAGRRRGRGPAAGDPAGAGRGAAGGIRSDRRDMPGGCAGDRAQRRRRRCWSRSARSAIR